MGKVFCIFRLVDFYFQALETIVLNPSEFFDCPLDGVWPFLMLGTNDSIDSQNRKETENTFICFTHFTDDKIEDRCHDPPRGHTMSQWGNKI